MKKLAASLLCAVCIAPALSAQEFTFGAQASIALPIGDAGERIFLNHRPGLGFGVHGFWNFYPRHVFVPRMDIVLYRRDLGGNALLAPPIKKAFTLKDIKVGVDYNLVFSNPGIYGIVGLGYSSFDWAISTDDILDRETKGALYFSLGTGYKMLEHFLAELRYTHASYSNVGTSFGYNGKSLTAPAISLSLLWRF